MENLSNQKSKLEEQLKPIHFPKPFREQAFHTLDSQVFKSIKQEFKNIKNTNFDQIKFRS